jgi:hypothetical protein
MRVFFSHSGGWRICAKRSIKNIFFMDWILGGATKKVSDACSLTSFLRQRFQSDFLAAARHLLVSITISSTGRGFGV